MAAPIPRRVSSGIPGLDRLIEGGLLANSVNLVTGGAGTGKTAFCLQFLWEGLQKGENGVFITLEQDPESILEDARNFGWDFERFIKKGIFVIKYHDPAQVNNIGAVIIDEIGAIKAKRLAIDSTSVIGLTLENISQIRKRLLSIVNTIKKVGCTAVITSEIDEESKALSRFGVEEFVVDGVFVMNYLGIGEEYNRSIVVRKMRRTNHGKDVYPMEISKKGVTVKKAEI